MNDHLSHRMTRRDFGRNALAAVALGPLAFSQRHALAQATPEPALETLSIGFYDWILGMYGAPITQVSEEFTSMPVTPQWLAGDFDPKRFLVEAEQGKSSYDLFIGMTPFVEMASLIDAGAIEPWDSYLPAGVLDDLPASIRDESSFDGKVYAWPVFYEIVAQSWNAAIVEQAGLDPEQAPKDWDEFIANATKVKESGAAPYGCTYDMEAWRSVIPVALSFSTDVFEEDGTFNWTSDAAVNALEVLRRMGELANPSINRGGDWRYAWGEVGYLVNYTAAHIMYSNNWPDRTSLRTAQIPAPPGGAGSTVFWNTSAALMTNGSRKIEAAAFMDALTHDKRLWQYSLTGDARVGQLPAYQSVWDGYASNPPDWLGEAPWAQTMWEGQPTATAIKPTKLGVDQFWTALDYYAAYLRGEEMDARAVLQKAKDAVAAKMAALS